MRVCLSLNMSLGLSQEVRGQTECDDVFSSIRDALRSAASGESWEASGLMFSACTKFETCAATPLRIGYSGAEILLVKTSCVHGRKLKLRP